MNRRMPLVVTSLVLLLLVSSCTAPTNHEPIITNLGAESARVNPSASCQIVCNASDADGDALSYNWSTSGGGAGYCPRGGFAAFEGGGARGRRARAS